MRFQPKSQKELDEEKLLTPGEYPFVISVAEDKISKKGNDMIQLDVRVFKPDGKFILVTDYLMEAMLYKLLHLCEAVGLSDKYNSGTLEANDFVGKEGYCKIKTQSSEGFSDKSVISDYVVPKDGEVKKPAPKKDDLDDALEDSIPF